MLEYNLIVLEQVGEKKWIRVLREELRENAMVCGIELIGVLWVVMGVKIWKNTKELMVACVMGGRPKEEENRKSLWIELMM